jgi:hypothetical protein
MEYLLTARTVEAEKQPLLDNDPYTRSRELFTYAVTSRNNRRGVASGGLCESALRLLLSNCAVNTFLQKRINMQQ